MVSIGLIIFLVGVGDKGFKSLELQLIGPSLIGKEKRTEFILKPCSGSHKPGPVKQDDFHIYLMCCILY